MISIVTGPLGSSLVNVQALNANPSFGLVRVTVIVVLSSETSKPGVVFSA